MLFETKGEEKFEYGGATLGGKDRGRKHKKEYSAKKPKGGEDAVTVLRSKSSPLYYKGEEIQPSRGNLAGGFLFPRGGNRALLGKLAGA